MIRSAVSKVVWVGRTTVFLVGLAVILAVVFGVASTALAHKADRGLFHLGHTNAGKALSTLVGTLATPILKVDNNGTGPALQLEAGSDQPPLVANADSGTVTNLFADELDGEDSAAYQRRVGGSCAEGSSIRTIDALGRATCETDDDGTAQADALRR